MNKQKRIRWLIISLASKCLQWLQWIQLNEKHIERMAFDFDVVAVVIVLVLVLVDDDDDDKNRDVMTVSVSWNRTEKKKSFYFLNGM